MDDISDNNYSDSDYELDNKKHDRLLEELQNLDGKLPVKKPSRTEPTLTISEYDLVKSITGNKDSVHIHELTKPLRARATHVEISKKIKKTHTKTKTLSKPLEKPQAEKIRRTVAYERTKEELDKWEPIVTAHRAAAHLSFPLNQDTKLEKNHPIETNYIIKTPLQIALENLDPKVEVYEIEREDEAPLTLQEMLERRKELAQLRRFQSQKENKARMQNKIKSKKYRKILRREKAKEQLKEFEVLQKTNPEEALKKLEEIERTRAQERASLRHKSTGKWAKNRQIRAKYDHESRQELAEQLAISRDLTTKQKPESDSDDEKDEIEIPIDPTELDNCWTNGIKPEKEIVDFLSGYRKFWEDKSGKPTNEPFSKEVTMENAEDVPTAESDGDLKNEAKKRKKSDGKKKPVEESPPKDTEEIKQTKPKKKRKKIIVSGTSGDWSVDDSFIDDTTYKLEVSLKNKLDKKAKKLKQQLNIPLTKKEKSASKKTNTKKKIDLKLKKLVQKQEIDEPLQETNKPNGVTNNKDLEIIRTILKTTVSKSTDEIEPDKFIKAKPVILPTETPDLYTTGDNEESNARGIIAEAFEDEDITEDFHKDKSDVIDKDTPKNIDLTLPGWGSWGGKGLKISKAKKKRFILRLPKELPRRDKNRGDLILNENASKSIKSHMVSELPFPFKSVKDYEASIRAPIGATFVSQTAFARHTKPAMSTKLGTVIEPMSDEVLLKKLKKKFKV